MELQVVSQVGNAEIVPRADAAEAALRVDNKGGL